MSEKCKFFDQCPILALFGEIGKHVMTRRFCFGEYCSCSRYQLHEAGKPVPVSLLPTADIGQVSESNKDNVVLFQTII